MERKKHIEKSKTYLLCSDLKINNSIEFVNKIY